MEIDPIMLDNNTEGQGMERESKFYMAFAFITLIAAYITVCLIPVGNNALGYLVLSAVFYAATLAVCLITGGKLNRGAVIALIFGMAFSVHAFIHGSSGFDIYPLFILSALAYGYFVVSLFGNNSGVLSGRFLLDVWKSVAFMFISFGNFFSDIFKPKGAKKHGRTILMAVCGIVAACILLVIVASLLSYDEHFVKMLPDLDIESIGEIFKKLIICVPLAALIYSVFASSRAHKMSCFSTEDAAERSARKMKVIPYLIVLLPAAALLALYVMFFISQWGYYMSAFGHTLPEGYSAAEYAREGFFQLCAVAGINAALIVLLGCFIKNEGRGTSLAVRIAQIVLAGATLILIATAVSKMLLYIDMYDLTRDRLCATLILIFMGLAFVFVILSAFIKKMKALPFILAAGLIMLLAFSFINTDRLIAKYNVDSYLSGKHQKIDTAYLAEDLGASGIIELKRLSIECGDETIRIEAEKQLKDAAKAERNYSRPWYAYDIPYIKAKEIIKEYLPANPKTN